MRLNLYEAGVLDELVRLRNAKTVSSVVREAIAVYYSMLKGSNVATSDNKIVIQNPNIVLNIVDVDSKAEAKNTNINVDVDVLRQQINVLESEKRMLRQQLEFYRKEVERLKAELDSLRGQRVEVKTVYRYRTIDIDGARVAEQLDAIAELIQHKKYGEAEEALRNLTKILKSRG